MTCRSRLWLYTLGLMAAGAVQAAELPIFDAHIHYNEDARGRTRPEAVIQILDRAGVRRALVSSTPNDGTLELYGKYPDRIVPMLRPYRTDADRDRWFRDAEIPAFVERELKRGVYRGIGEFHLQAGQTGTDAIRGLIKLAVERNLVLHAHSDEGAIRELYAIAPQAKILWAHAGMSAAPQAVGALLDRQATLWVDLSLRQGDIAPGGSLDPAWRELFQRHPDRFLLGTDTWAPHRWEEVTTEVAAARRWLAQLPGDVAAKIATGNAERLFPR